MRKILKRKTGFYVCETCTLPYKKQRKWTVSIVSKVAKIPRLAISGKAALVIL